MQINLDLIKPSPNPVRTSWDEDAMNELAESIREQGVIVPIKVRPSNGLPSCPHHGTTILDEDHEWGEANPYDCIRCEEIHSYVYGDDYDNPIRTPFEIVYGHRRAEASRRAGLTEIPAIVEGVDDTDALIQALIENIQREDMSAYDKGTAIMRLKDETGWTYSEMHRRGIATVNNLSMWTTVKKERDAGVSLISNGYGEGIEQTVQLKRALGDDLEAKKAVAEKVVKERLDRFETRKVAETYARARTPEEREAVLKVPGKIPAYDRAVKVQAGIDRSEQVKERKKTKRLQEDDRAVAEFLDMMRAFKGMVRSTFDAIDYGRFSPEGKRFAVRRIDELINELQELKEQLSNE